MAIMEQGKTKNTLTVIQTPPSAQGGHNIIGLTPSAMESLELFEGDTVLLKGKVSSFYVCRTHYQHQR